MRHYLLKSLKEIKKYVLASCGNEKTFSFGSVVCCIYLEHASSLAYQLMAERKQIHIPGKLHYFHLDENFFLFYLYPIIRNYQHYIKIDSIHSFIHSVWESVKDKN
jgi:hypothetical protein